MKRALTFLYGSTMFLVTLLCIAVFWQRNVGLPQFLHWLEWVLSPVGFTVTVILPTAALLLSQVRWITKHD